MKNNCIEFWRIIFTIGVAVMHFGLINGFYIAVDFFFMLSGWLLAKKVKSCDENCSGTKIFFAKIKRLMPEYFFAFFLMLIFNVWFLGIDFNEIYCVDSILEMLFLHVLLPVSNINNGITWYISALVICMPIFIYLLKYYYHGFSCIVAPVVSLFIYAYFLSTWGHVDFGLVWIGSCNGGFLRAFAGLSAGVFLYYISNSAGEIISCINSSLVSSLDLFIGLLLVFIAMLYRGTKIDSISLLLIGLLIILSFNDFGWLRKLTSNKLISYLGEISYSMYVNQLFVGGIVRKGVPDNINFGLTILIYVFSLVIFSGISHWIVRTFMKIKSVKLKIALCSLVFGMFWIVSIGTGHVSLEGFGKIVYFKSV